MTFAPIRTRELVTPVSLEQGKRVYLEAFSKGVSVPGFLPNSILYMARDPELVEAVAHLVSVVSLRQGRVPKGLKNLVGHIASMAAGCRYCAAHQGHNAAIANGVPPEKVEAVWEFETSPLFTDAERAALRFALAAGSTPNAVDDALIEQLHDHFDDDQILEIVSVIAMFGFMNRWNDTFATPLEDRMTTFGDEHLAPGGWEAGRHSRDVAFS